MQSANLALQAGRLLQKKQTGFVHYCYQCEDGQTHDTIPVLENALFALSLFRSRISDHVLEGKALVERLLPFEREGNFPLYLHEFPQTLDPYLGLRLLPVFFWMVTDFGHVMGGVKEALIRCIDQIICHAEGIELPDWAQFRLDAFKGRVGFLPNTLYDWSEALISLQIAEKKGVKIEEAIQEGCKLWHRSLRTYIGPAHRRHQMREEPDLTVFDLFMSQWDQSLDDQMLRPIHLRGALIRPLSIKPTFCEKPMPFIHFNPKEECPLWIGWERHTFVLAGKHLKVEGDAEELILHCNSEEEIPVNFYLDYHSDHEVFINGGKATTFCAGDRVEIRSKGVQISLSFSMQDGTYFGHLMRGNRPSQHGCKGNDHFTAFDWRIAIRVVRPGTSPMRVRLQVDSQKLENPQPLPLHASHCPHTESSP